MNTQIVMYTTADGFNLYGAWYEPQGARTALLMIHGYCSNFYRTPLRAVAEYLAPRGYACLVVNTRGHDRLANTESAQPAEGALVERISESPRDLDAGLDWLRAHGYRRIILVGHSLGGLKSIHYAARQPANEIIGLVSCSCPRWNTPAYPEDSPVVAQARSMRAEGQEYHMLYDDEGNNIGSPAMILDRIEHFEDYHPEPNAGRITCPALYIAAADEPEQFRLAAEELTRAGGKSASSHIIADTDHVYSDHELDLAHTVERWLDQVENKQS